MTLLRDSALAYAAAGYEVFPLRGKDPYGSCPECRKTDGGRPNPRYREHKPSECSHELCHGFYAGTTDLDLITRWWRRWPNANIGARVPRPFLVLDVDPRNGGGESLARLEVTYGTLPETRTSVSGRGDGGFHLWWLHPGGRPSDRALGRGLDLKDHRRGYMVMPPSVHPATGGVYHWANPAAESVGTPGWFRQLVDVPSAPALTVYRPTRDTSAYVTAAIAGVLDRLQTDGGHFALVRAAYNLGGLAHLGMDEQAVVEALADAALINAGGTRDRAKALKTAAECFAAGKDRPRALAGAS